MRLQRKLLFVFTVCFLVSCATSHALNVTVDYRYDVNGFFSPGTINGAAARATVNAAATFFSGLINDTLSAIPAPTGGNRWRQVIKNPGTGQVDYAISSASAAQDPGANEYRDIQIASNQFLIYAGATSLGSAGIGGTGFNSFGTTSFNDLIAHRGKPSNEYAAWGGYVSFDNSINTTWQYDYTQPVGAGKVDLYSTALHEIGHVLGLSPNLAQPSNPPPVWQNFQVGAEFRGAQALAAWKADDPAALPAATGVPTVSSTDTHWKDNSVKSKVITTNQLQEAAMDPVIFTGTRKLLSNET